MAEDAAWLGTAVIPGICASRTYLTGDGPQTSLTRLVQGTVLIIDADRAFANELAQALIDAGVDASTTADPKAGLEIAGANPPDAIVLCAELPRISGFVVCNKLKQDEALAHVPVLLTSALATEEVFEQHRLHTAPAQAYLHKPVAVDAIFQMLAPLLGTGDAATIGERPGLVDDVDDDVLCIPVEGDTLFDGTADDLEEEEDEDPSQATMVSVMPDLSDVLGHAGTSDLADDGEPTWDRTQHTDPLPSARSETSIDLPESTDRPITRPLIETIDNDDARAEEPTRSPLDAEITGELEPFEAEDHTAAEPVRRVAPPRGVTAPSNAPPSFTEPQMRAAGARAAGARAAPVRAAPVRADPVEPDDDAGETGASEAPLFDLDAAVTPVLSAPEPPPPPPVDGVVAELQREVAAAREAQAEADHQRNLALAAERAALAQVELSSRPSQILGGGSSSREVVELKKERNAKEREVLDLRRLLHDKEADALAWQDREAELEAKIVELEEAFERYAQEKALLLAERAAADARLAELERVSAETSQELKRRIGEQTVRESELEGQIQKLNVGLRSATAEVAALTSMGESLQRARDEANTRLNAVEADASDRKAALERITDELTTATELGTTLREQLAAKTEAADAAAEHTAEVESELARARAETHQARGALAEMEGNLEKARETIREDDKNRTRALQALDVFWSILKEAGYTDQAAVITDDDLDEA